MLPTPQNATKASTNQTSTDPGIEMVQVAATSDARTVIKTTLDTVFVDDDDYDDSDDLTDCECGRLILTVLAVMLIIIASLVCLFSKQILIYKKM
jgi:hypothetical protein